MVLFKLYRYDDSGSMLGAAMGVERATGYVEFENRVGIGVSPDSPLHVRSTTTPQFQIDYDASNYITLESTSGGNAVLTSGNLFTLKAQGLTDFTLMLDAAAAGLSPNHSG